MVIESIRENDTETQQLLLTVVETVPDPKISKALAEKLGSSQDTEIQRQANTVVENATAEIEEKKEALNRLLPLKSVDVRYCNFGANRASNQELAQSADKFLVAMNDREFGGFRLSSSIITPMGEARARSLTSKVGTSFIDIRYDRDDPDELAFVKEVSRRLKKEFDVDFTLQGVGTKSRNSFSIFVCR